MLFRDDSFKTFWNTDHKSLTCGQMCTFYWIQESLLDKKLSVIVEFELFWNFNAVKLIVFSVHVIVLLKQTWSKIFPERGKFLF